MHGRIQPRRELIPYVILVAALALTSAFAWYAHVSGTRQDRLTFDNTSEAVRSAIESRLDAYVAMLLGGAGLFAASDDVTRAEFLRYVGRLDLARRYPGIQGIGYTRVVRPEERTSVLAAMRREFPQFTFWPDQPSGDINAIVYLEPLDDRNRLALGYDMGSEETRRVAMDRARDAAVPAATGIVQLVQERHDPLQSQAGFLVYVPVYAGGGIPATVAERRSALDGFVYSPFRADDLLQGIIPTEIPSVARFEVFDGPVGNGLALHQRRWVDHHPRFSVERPVNVAGRTWTVLVQGGSELRVTGSRAVVALVLAGGLLLSLLLFAVTRGQVQARLAAERTAEGLRTSEERLRAADRAKDEFLATVSHELRTPLNAIVGWTSILRTRTVSEELQSRAVGAIGRNAAALTRLVEDLLDMSRAVGGHLSLKTADIDARATLQAAVDTVQPLASEAGLAITAELDESLGTIQADAGRIQQIVTNLLTNSVKFTKPGGRITVRARRAGEALVFSVQDTGIGIEPAFMPFLFDRFRQADSSPTRAHGGTGLGLAIVQHLVHLHGGSIHVVSPGPGEGATFTVRLPVRRKPGI